MEAGIKIKKVREFKNLSQEFVAQKLGISQESYSRLENGQTKLDLKRLQDIATVLEIDPTLLLSFDDSFTFNHCTQCGKVVHNYNGHSKEEKHYLELRLSKLEAEIAKLKGN